MNPSETTLRALSKMGRDWPPAAQSPAFRPLRLHSAPRRVAFPRYQTMQLCDYRTAARLGSC